MDHMCASKYFFLSGNDDWQHVVAETVILISPIKLAAAHTVVSTYPKQARVGVTRTSVRVGPPRASWDLIFLLLTTQEWAEGGSSLI